MTTTSTPAPSAHDTGASAAQASASSAFLTDEHVIAHLAARGCVGPFTDQFLGEIRWSIASRAFMKALADTGAYPNTVEGHQAFVDELLAMTPADVPAIPQGAAVRTVCERAGAIINEEMAELGIGEPSRADTNQAPASPRERWNALVAEFDAVNAIKGDDITDEIIERAGDLIGEIMDMPAPDTESVRWKLDYLLDPSDGSEPGAYSREYLAQTVADYRRFLADQPEQPKPEDWLTNLAAFRKAEAEQRQFVAHGDGTDEKGDPLFQRFASALDKVLLTPAPDFPALAEKLAIYDANEIDDGWNLAREMTALLAQDAARLSWQAALVPFERATAALDDCHEDDEIDAGAHAQLEVMVPLLLTPAPDAEALNRKLAIISRESAWDLDTGCAIMDTLAADLRRLTAGA
jgi:hypothetical protein